MSRELFEPAIDSVSLEMVMQALGDDLRLQIVRTLADEGECVCGTIELGVSKATRSHHYKTLREAGVTHTRVEGTSRHVSLRREELDARFPGLLGAVISASALAVA